MLLKTSSSVLALILASNHPADTKKDNDIAVASVVDSVATSFFPIESRGDVAKFNPWKLGRHRRELAVTTASNDSRPSSSSPDVGILSRKLQSSDFCPASCADPKICKCFGEEGQVEGVDCVSTIADSCRKEELGTCLGFDDSGMTDVSIDYGAQCEFFECLDDGKACGECHCNAYINLCDQFTDLGVDSDDMMAGFYALASEMFCTVSSCCKAAGSNAEKEQCLDGLGDEEQGELATACSATNSESQELAVSPAVRKEGVALAVAAMGLVALI
jgi:hypothetical protein